MKFYILSLFCCFYISSFAQFSNVKKGDIIDVNGVKGLVFMVNEDGNHGTIMSVKAFRGDKNLFCTKASHLKGIDMSSKSEGSSNTKNLFDYASSNKIPLQQFPVFHWCKSLGKGWYIPSVEQLNKFINYWIGNEIEEEDWDEDETENKEKEVPQKKAINNTLLNAGGIPFLNGVFTSTIDNDGKIHVFQYDRKKDFWQFIQLNPMKIDADCVGRAFYDF